MACFMLFMLIDGLFYAVHAVYAV